MGEHQEKKTRKSFWHVGARTWKTVAAVFMSMFVDALRPGGMPFYAGITAVFCVQKSVHDSLEVSVNREISTVLGGIIGMVFLIVEQAIGKFEPPVVRFALLALALVPIISLSVWMGRPKSTFLMCVVFLSVAIVHEEDVHPFYYAMNRILDTTIGIVAALVANSFPWRGRRARQVKEDGEALNADGAHDD